MPSNIQLTTEENEDPQARRRSQDRRKALGIYYTPPEAAMVLARWAIRSPNEVILEPSFGGCALLGAAVNVLEALGCEDPSMQLHGYDVDPAAFEHLAQMGISNDESHFKKQDFLRSTVGTLRVNAVIANPPYVSHHRQSEKQRDWTNRLRQRYLPSLPRLASLWAYFILHSVSYLLPGGRMAFVLPNAIGNADYGKPLLAHLQKIFQKIELVHLAERLFIQAGADERISILLLDGFMPEGVPTPQPLIIKDVKRISEILVHDDATAGVDCAPRSADLRGTSTVVIDQLLGKSLVNLGSVAAVHIGEVIGDIRFFVRSMQEWKTLGVGEKYLKPLLTRSAQTSGLDAVSSKEDKPIPYILLPNTGRNIKAIEQYLSTYPIDEIGTNKTFGKRDFWYRCSYSPDADAFIGSMNHEYPRIIGNPRALSCSNSYYKIVSLQDRDIAKWLPILGLTTPLRLSAEIHGRVRGSGGIKLEPSDVKLLSVPAKLPKLENVEFERFRKKLDDLVRTREIESASQLADSVVFLKPKLIDAGTLSELRKKRLTLTKRRLEKH